MESLQKKVITVGNRNRIKPLSMQMSVCSQPQSFGFRIGIRSSVLILTHHSMPLDVCMLAQEGPLDHHSIYFASRRLSAWELYNHRTFFIMIRPIPKTQDRAPDLLITTYQKEECEKFLFSRFDYKPGSEDEKKKHKLPRSCSRLSRCHLRWMPPFHLKADRALSQLLD
jgi:hypothetical protein